jgi:hypothetical protein
MYLIIHNKIHILVLSVIVVIGGYLGYTEIKKLKDKVNLLEKTNEKKNSININPNIVNNNEIKQDSNFENKLDNKLENNELQNNEKYLYTDGELTNGLARDFANFSYQTDESTADTEEFPRYEQNETIEENKTIEEGNETVEEENKTIEEGNNTIEEGNGIIEENKTIEEEIKIIEEGTQTQSEQLLICLAWRVKMDLEWVMNLKMEEQRELNQIFQHLQHGMRVDGILIMIPVVVMEISMLQKVLIQENGLVQLQPLTHVKILLPVILVRRVPVNTLNLVMTVMEIV